MKHIPELDGLRGLMSVWVVVGHMLAILPAFPAGIPNTLRNWDAVHVFIILSGFVIFAALDNRRQSYRSYITARAFRIFPAYLVVLAVSTLSLSFAASALSAFPDGVATDMRIALIRDAQARLGAYVLTHIPLIQGLIPTQILPASSYALIGQAWSLSVEWQFYLGAPFLLMILSSLGKRWAQAAVLLVLGVCAILGRWLDDGFFGNNLPMFSTGFLSYFLLKRGYLNSAAINPRVLMMTAILLSLLFGGRYMLPLVVWWLAFFSLATARQSGAKTAIARMLGSRLSAYLGRISYSLYLVHMQVLFGCIWLAEILHLPRGASFVSIPMLGLIASILVADALNRTIEAPMHRYGQAKARRIDRMGERDPLSTGL